MLELEVPASKKAGTELQVGEFEVTWRSMADNGRLDSTKLPACVRVVSVDEFEETGARPHRCNRGCHAGRLTCQE